VTAARRLSPRVLIEQLSVIGKQIARFWQAVDLDALGAPVSWAGPGPMPVWLDAARDFTEYWTHHQQIYDATGRNGLADPRYLGPVIGTFVRALPHTLAEVPARPAPAFSGITPERAARHVRIDGDQRLATAALQIVSILWSPSALSRPENLIPEATGGIGGRCPRRPAPLLTGACRCGPRPPATGPSLVPVGLLSRHDQAERCL